MSTSDTPTQPARNLLVFTLSVIGKVFPVFYFAFMSKISYLGFQKTGEIAPLVLLALNALFVCMLVIRRDTKEISTAPGVWLLSIGVCMAPLFFRAADVQGFPSVGLPLQFIGFFLVMVALLSLNRSFGIVPANRGVRQGGFYRIVRHPLYATELLSMLGFVVCYPTVLNITVWMVLLLGQLARIYAEERLLSRDPVYLTYRDKVRFRLIPGVI